MILYKYNCLFNLHQMIILNTLQSKKHDASVPSVAIHDLNDYNTTDDYYNSIWKHKYNVIVDSRNVNFKKNLVNYLKGNIDFVE